MTPPVRRFLAIGLAVVLIVGVGIAVISSIQGRLGPSAVPIHGVIGSEKLPFFQDPRVIAAFHRGGFDVSVDTAGSRQIATLDLSADDFAFPAGAPAAEKIRRTVSGTTSVVPFFTPMAIATWQPIVDLLTTAGLVKTAPQGYLTLDMNKYMELVAQDTRWKDLQGNTTYPVNKSILMTSTDVRRSNSAAMYLSIASYVANGNNVVQNDSNIDNIVNLTAPLFLKQGFVESSSEEPFNEYLVQGIGKAPMVVIYEGQYLARAAANDGSITPDMRLIYLDPTIYSNHTWVGLTDAGKRAGDFLSTDPELRSLITEYGFRTSDTQGFQDYFKSHNVTVPTNLIDVIEPPSYEALEAMITRIEGLYSGQGLPSPAPDFSPSE
jgi:hypothetical protein